jgi:type I restriction enzyme S subunit
MKSIENNGPAPRLRFLEFRDAGPWEVKRLGELITTITPPKKIQTTDYQQIGQFPIVDQSPSDICGWTDDETALVEASFPVVIFGDHSCVVKLVSSPFAQGADGIKILSPSEEISARFLFLSLQANPVEQKGYNRHFSALKEKLIPFPKKDTGEQKKIADCLSSLDDLIRAEGERLAALKDHKRGLMQQLFPRPDEVTPRLRFPAFRKAVPWEVKRLGEIGTIVKGKGISKSDIKPGGSLPCIRYGELYTFYGEIIREVASRTDADPADLVLSEEDDVIIPASGETKGDIARASCVTTKGVALGGDLNIFRSPLNGSFLAYYIRGNLQSEVSKVAQGDSVVHLYPAQLERLQLSVPPTVEEQQKIADCLTALDDLIRVHGARVEALKVHKRGLMQQLFPQVAG